MTPETSIYEYAKRGLAKSAKKTALWFRGRNMSFIELFARIDNAAGQLMAMGVRQGTVVTIHLPNCPQAVVAFYAVAKIGAICNMVHAQMPANGLRELMDFTESDILFTYSPQCVDMADYTIFVDLFSTGAMVNKIPWPSLTLEDVFPENSCPNTNIPNQKLLAQECAAYLHSSGSTGHPKTIMLSHSAINYCAENTADLFKDGDMAEHVSLGVLPMFHGFGLVMDVHRNVAFGSKLVQMERWDTKEAIRLIKEHKVTSTVGVPTMYHALLRDDEFSGPEISQLMRCCVGGDNISSELVEQFDARVGGKGKMLVGYGLTEATTTNLVNSYLHYKSGSCGYPMRTTMAAVLDADGNLAYSGIGELLIGGKTLMMGYLNDPIETEKTIVFRDGKRWVRTGDQVEIDEEGFVFFRDRLKNIINHNGYNVYPAQVEEIIKGVSGVRDVCVVGALNQELGTQNVRAVIIPENEKSQTDVESALIQACVEHLPRYSVPSEVVFLSAFPQNAMGKVDRKKMAQTL